jgi:CRP-like cAMP-binding protein
MDPLEEIDRQIAAGRRHGKLDPAILHSLELGTMLAEPTLGQLCDMGRWHAHSEGETILTSGAASATVYIVARGVVQEYLEAATGEVATTDFLVRGDVLDAGGLRFPLPDLIRARAIDQVITFALARPVVQDIAATHPALGMFLEQQGRDRWSRLALLYLDRTLNRRAGLVAHLLARLSAATGQPTLQMKQVTLARLFNVSRAQLIRDLALLERNGFIRLERDGPGISILKPQDLAHFDDLTGEV